MKRAIVLALGLIACATPRALVKAENGPVCQGDAFPADAPCLEKGQPAPFGGIELTPEKARAWVDTNAKTTAAEDSLRKSLLVDIAIAVALIIAAAYGGYELGHAVK